MTQLTTTPHDLTAVREFWDKFSPITADIIGTFQETPWEALDPEARLEIAVIYRDLKNHFLNPETRNQIESTIRTALTEAADRILSDLENDQL